MKTKILFLCFCLLSAVLSCSEGPIDNMQNNIESDTLVPEKETYCNPVLQPGVFEGKMIASMADPFVLKDIDGTYYMYVTGKGFNVFSSKDLVNWKYRGECFIGEGVKWAKEYFWAPEVIFYKGKYYLHYTSSEAKDSPKRIGLAVSDSPTGPFTDVSDRPFFSHAENQGCIDSHIFIDDDGSLYLYYSKAMSENIFDDSGRKRSEIWVVRLKEDLSGTIGEPQQLLIPEQSWEYQPERKLFWNEGANILKKDNRYYLLYSANSYAAAKYGIGYATSDSPMGPFKKFERNPILSNARAPYAVSGPGHNCVIPSPDGTELICVYHSHVDIKNPSGKRMINIDRIGFNPDGTLSIKGPTYTKQPKPSDNR